MGRAGAGTESAPPNGRTQGRTCGYAARLSSRRHDHPGSLLHLREDRRQQVGGLFGTAAGRVHRGGRPGCTRSETLLLSPHAAGTRGSDREAAQLCTLGEVTTGEDSCLLTMVDTYPAEFKLRPQGARSNTRPQP
uniref:DNA-directed RNA polymerases I, II, and III subunit RPABC5 n=1 Tax=Heterocephalus glaber TaxID=10181 RepID=A0A0P6IYK2_HETGA